MGRLSGKVAIVTGGGRGIGRAICQVYAAEGAKVAIVSRTESTVKGAETEIRATGGDAIGITCDVGHEDQIKSMVESTVKAFGPIDILVNNAHSFGTADSPVSYPHPQPLIDISDAEWDFTMRTGLMSSLWCMRAVFPHMKDRGGKIINFSSRSGQRGEAGTGPYNCSKEAIRALTRTAAREWGKLQINVNVISPTSHSRALADAHRDYPVAGGRESTIPLGRIGDPVHDIGGVALFLATSNSDYITGMTMYANGGSDIWS